LTEQTQDFLFTFNKRS